MSIFLLVKSGNFNEPEKYATNNWLNNNEIGHENLTVIEITTTNQYVLPTS